MDLLEMTNALPLLCLFFFYFFFFGAFSVPGSCGFPSPPLEPPASNDYYSADNRAPLNVQYRIVDEPIDCLRSKR